MLVFAKTLLVCLILQNQYASLQASVQCYGCLTEYSSDCGDPFGKNASYITTCSTTCQKILYYAAGNPNIQVARVCASDCKSGSIPYYTGPATSYCCSTNLCNNATSLSAYKWIPATLLFLTVGFFLKTNIF